ncbi:MAG: hypothetical protein E5X14_15200 [Mesorhizobium sp.]|nr:MAG: hypothetical protein E5X14_15200 [Mesorhizobium sp.]
MPKDKFALLFIPTIHCEERIERRPRKNFWPRRCPSSACRHLLRVKDGETGQTPALATPSPRSSRGEGKGEGQRQLLKARRTHRPPMTPI